MYISDHIITSKHYLVHFVSAFALGIYLAVRFGIVFSLALTLTVFIVSILIFVCLKILNLLKNKYIILSVLLIAATTLGISRIYYADYIQFNYIRQYQDKEIWLCGTVTSDPHLTTSGHYYSFELDVFGVADKTGSFGTVIMYTPSDLGCSINSGDNIYAWTSLKVPSGNETSSHFDYNTHLRGKNIFLTGNARNINLMPDSIKPAPITVFKNTGAWLREKILYSINMIFPDNNICSTVLKGILIGDKSGFDDELYEKFAYSGISHIVAVSGLHMSILFSFLMIASKRFYLNKKLNLLITIPVILLFMSASAFTPSVCRASIMILIVICSTLFREEYNPVTSLFLALGLILAVSPYALFSKSLILSFFATLGIFVYYSYIGGIFKEILDYPRLHLKHHKIIRKCLLYISSSMVLSLSSLIGTAYFLVLFFGSISKVQFLTNLWIIPLVSVIFCLGYACCILYYISPWLVTTILKYPLMGCLEIVKFTVDKFGKVNNVLIISAESFDGIAAIIYFGIALMVYMLLKTFKDIKTENDHKNKKAS